MITIGPILSPETDCSYLPGRNSRLAYSYIQEMTAEEYGRLMLKGWRRFGRTMFVTRCLQCDECRSLRVDLKQFKPNQSQKRCWKANHNTVRLQIGKPSLTQEKLRIYNAYHLMQADTKGWAERDEVDANQYLSSFVDHPFPTEEWCYYLGDELVGIGYVDVLPVGYSAIYFYHAPQHRPRGLGTFNIMKLIEHGLQLGHEYLYLGYYVADCGSLKYKANFKPYQLCINGVWVDGA